MDYLHMNTLNDTLSDSVIEDAVNLWTSTNSEHASVLKHVCGNIADKYIPFAYQDKSKLSHDQVRGNIILHYHNSNFACY